MKRANVYKRLDKGEQGMKLKNILIVVKDIEKSKRFYHDLFGLDMVLDLSLIHIFQSED